MKSEYIDNLKKIENIRFLQLNVNRIRSCNEKKIQYFIEVCNLHRVDCFILTEMNIKWTILITDKIKNKLKNLGRELQLSFADSTNYTATTIDWLQGGIINSIRVAIANLCNPTLFHKDKFGKQTTFAISNNKKVILVTTIYKIPSSNNGESSTSIVQYNTIEARIKNTTHYRK